jgi:hypothetical protein
MHGKHECLPDGCVFCIWSERAAMNMNYEALAGEIGRLTDTKSKQYGDSAERAEKIMKVLYPNGVPVEAFRNALLIVRMCDKLCRIATQDTTGVDGGGEDAWRDMAGYSLIGAKRNTEAK